MQGRTSLSFELDIFLLQFSVTMLELVVLIKKAVVLLLSNCSRDGLVSRARE